MPLALLPFILLIVPHLEIAMFIVVGGQIGVLPTIGLVLLTAVTGAFLLRREGFRVLTAIRADMDAGRVPAKALGEGAMVMAAGLLLLTPGFVTDTVGILLFLPPVRRALWRIIASRLTIVRVDPRRGGPVRPGVVDLDPSDYVRRDPTGSR